jgi:phage baseplate assembly protein W
MLQPIFPLSRSDADGFYKSHSEIKDSVKQNFMFLLQTSPGEWPGRPEIGVGLRQTLFENYSPAFASSFIQRIKHQVSLYMPFLNVDIKFDTTDSFGNSTLDSNYIKVRISYDVQALSAQGVLNFKVSETSIEAI